jgi:hypothetical protein
MRNLLTPKKKGEKIMKGYKMYSKRKREKVLEKIREELAEFDWEKTKDELLQESSKIDDVVAFNIPIIMDGTKIHVTGIGENFVSDKVIIKLDIELSLDALEGFDAIGKEFR